MNVKALPTYRIQPLVRADKARREIREQAKAVKKEIKREFADRETKVISILVAVFLVFCFITQIADIGPVYLADFM